MNSAEELVSNRALTRELLVCSAESRERKTDSLTAPAKPSSSSCRASALV